MTNILYISSLCSPQVLDYLFNSSSTKPLQSIQKFHRMFTEGIKLSDDTVIVETLSSVPVPANHKKWLWRIPMEKFNNIHYRYIPFINRCHYLFLFFF